MNHSKANPLALLFHSPLDVDSLADELDVLDEAAYFKEGLLLLGFDVHVYAFPYDISHLKTLIETLKPSVIVNLVETLFSNGKLVIVGPVLFEHFRVPFTGCGADATYVTSNKVLAKQVLLAHGIPTPEYYRLEDVNNLSIDIPPKSFLVKSVWEHASFGLDEGNQLLFESKEALRERFSMEGKEAVNFFAEEYIHGREFNISLLGGEHGPEVLPIAEIRFEYPEGMPRIVGYKAKWDESSFEYHHTVRHFDFNQEDDDLLQRLKEICLHCWSIFNLKGYARVDFRVDREDSIYVLEINTNPCISSDSGFVAAATKAGYSQKQLISRILSDLSNS